jgi:hypothetical protein
LFHKILYFFLDPEGRSYFINDATKAIDKSSTPVPLELSPEGGQSILIACERDIPNKDLSVNKGFSLPSTFVRKAGQILKSVVYSKNIGEKIFLLIQKLKVTVNLAGLSFRMQYQFLFKGEVDLTSFIDKDVRTSITVSEGGISKKLKANEGNIYEFDLDTDPETVLVEDDGLKLFDTINFIATPVSVNTPNASNSHYVPIAFTTRDGNAVGVGAHGQVFADPYGDPTSDENSHYFLGVTQDIAALQINGKIKIRVPVPAPNTFRYFVRIVSNYRPGTTDSNGVAYLNFHGPAGEPVPTDGLITVDFETNPITISASAGERFFIYAKTSGNSVIPVTAIDYLDSSFFVFFGSRYKTSYVKGLPLSVLAKRLIGKVTGDENDIDTTFLQQYDYIVFTSQDGLRALPGSKIKTTLKDIDNFIWNVLGASRGIENGKIIYADFSHFFNPDNPIPLGEVANLEVSIAKDLICNSIKAGWTVQEAGDKNGKDSFNNTSYFSCPLDLEQPKAWELTSSYITDPFYQEIIRLNLEGKVSTDDKNDNSIIVFNTENKTQVVNATNVLIDTATDGNYFTITGADDKIGLFKVKFKVTGTTSNDGTYTVKKIVQGIGLFNVFVNENIVTEVAANAQFTIEFHTLRRPAYSSITGIPDPDSIYNIELFSPKRILLKHAKWINSIFYNFQGQKIKFETTEKNSTRKLFLMVLPLKKKQTMK